MKKIPTQRSMYERCFDAALDLCVMGLIAAAALSGCVIAGYMLADYFGVKLP